MVHYGNFVNNHLAAVFSQPKFASAIAAKGHKPLPVAPVAPVTPSQSFGAKLLDATGHLFRANVGQQQ